MEDEHRRALLHRANLLAGLAFFTVGAVNVERVFFTHELETVL